MLAKRQRKQKTFFFGIIGICFLWEWAKKYPKRLNDDDNTAYLTTVMIIHYRILFQSRTFVNYVKWNHANHATKASGFFIVKCAFNINTKWHYIILPVIINDDTWLTKIQVHYLFIMKILFLMVTLKWWMSFGGTYFFLEGEADF